MNNELNWASKYIFETFSENIINSEIKADTAYSTVYKIESKSNQYYLKKVPETLSDEADIYYHLKEQHCRNTPIILAHNKKYNCFILRSCGEKTLRSLFKTKLDFTLLYQGIEHYTQIQRKLESSPNKLLALPIQDWTLAKFSTLYKDLISNEALLSNDGLSNIDLKTLTGLELVVKDLCKEIASYNIPETINHGDFQDNNIVLCTRTNKVTIIDWAETVFGHPFFSLNTCLWNMGYFHGIKDGSIDYNNIAKHCIKSWLNMYPEQDLLEVMNLVKKIHGVYAALNFYHLYKATENQERTVLDQHKGAIAGCLGTFINANP